MKVKKYLKIAPSKITKEIKKIRDHFSEEFPNLKEFYFSLNCKDTEYLYDNLTEFLEDLPDIKHVTIFLITFSLLNKENDKLEIRLQTYDKNYVSIEINYKNRKSSEKYIDELAAILKVNTYKYNPLSETRNEIKEKITECSTVLNNCQNYHSRRNQQIKDEKDVQSFLYPILKSHFEDLEDEFFLPKYAGISYKPDFGIPSIKLLIEIKFLRQKSDLKKIQKEIIDDSVGYIKSSNKYKEIIVYIYNHKNLPVEEKYTKDLEKINVIRKVLISPGISTEMN